MCFKSDACNGCGSAFEYSSDSDYVFPDIRQSGYGNENGTGYGLGDSIGNGDSWGRHEIILTLEFTKGSEGKGSNEKI